jgi:hypothetical protein
VVSRRSRLLRGRLHSERTVTPGNDQAHIQRDDGACQFLSCSINTERMGAKNALSKRIASASSAAGIRPSALNVFRSNITTDWSVPEVANPCPVAGASAVPCAPCEGPRAANAVAADGRPRLDGVIGWSRIRAVAGGAADGRASLSRFPPLEPGPDPRPARRRHGRPARRRQRVAGARLQGQGSRSAGTRDPPPQFPRRGAPNVGIACAPAWT